MEAEAEDRDAAGIRPEHRDQFLVVALVVTIRPDCTIEVRNDVREKEDEPMLLHGLKGRGEELDAELPSFLAIPRVLKPRDERIIRWSQVRLPSVASVEEGVLVGPPTQTSRSQSSAVAHRARCIVTIGLSIRWAANRNRWILHSAGHLGLLNEGAVYA